VKKKTIHNTVYFGKTACSKCTLVWIVFMVSVLLSPKAQAQKATISGVVTNASTGETIPYANILKKGSTTGTYTDNEGYFELNLEPGNITLVFTCISYRDTTVVLDLDANEKVEISIALNEDAMLMDELVVSANRVANKVAQLADLRDQQNSNLEGYTSSIYKLAILGPLKFTENDTIIEPTAFSERVSEIRHMMKPERYSEIIKANRASKNFFSEYDFFTTGGPPLNLNQDKVSLSILSEDLTVTGPISDNAWRYYELTDEPADSSWPENTFKITFLPKYENRPLFSGSVWFNENSSSILKIDVTLNEYASTNNGLFSIQNLHYEQEYELVDEFWLPEKTILSADLKFLGTSNILRYKDEWSWSDHQVNPKSLSFEDVELSTSILMSDAHKKKNAYWDSVEVSHQNTNETLLKEAKNYTEENRTLRLGMSAMSTFFRLPYQLERFYLTNINDLYHFNRVEGHYLGLGLRTPIHSDYDYRATIGYGFAQKDIQFRISAQHYFPGTAFAPDITYQNQVIRQYQDYEYNQTPIDFFGFRQTMNSLISGTPVNNYFNKRGWSAGLKYRFDVESFIRVLYLDQTHTSLSSNTSYNLLGNKIDPVLYPNNDPVYPAISGHLKGISVHLHHDTRKYLRTQFLRDYNIRDFGWLTDIQLEKGIADWGSDFDFTRYRFGLMFNIPVFSAHFLEIDFISGASDAGTPGQRMHTFNGHVVDDYVRKRPFNTISFKEPVGFRTTSLNINYRFGSSITRKVPVSFIQKSGIMFSTFFSAGLLDQNPSLEPLLHPSKDNMQAEIGISAFKIFGFIYMEFSKRLIGDYGNEIGFVVLF